MINLLVKLLKLLHLSLELLILSKLSFKFGRSPLQQQDKKLKKKIDMNCHFTVDLGKPQKKFASLLVPTSKRGGGAEPLRKALKTIDLSGRTTSVELFLRLLLCCVFLFLCSSFLELC